MNRIILFIDRLEKICINFTKTFFMSRGSKIFTGLLSFLPLILSGVLIFQVFALFPQFFEWDKHEPEPYTVFATITPLFITGILTGILSFGLLVFFIIHMINNKKLDTTERLVWILVFLLAGVIGYPVYWYMRIWTEKE